MRTFCTSGPVDKKTCYYVKRPDIMAEALNYIEKWRYFTVSAPKQSGKTTLLRNIVERIKDKYLTIFISFESYGEKDKKDFFRISPYFFCFYYCSNQFFISYHLF